MERPAKRAKLLSDESSSDESEHIDVDVKTSDFKVNEEYARRFEHNKKREERQRLEEKYRGSSKSHNGNIHEGELAEDEDDSEEEESEDDDGELATHDVDDEIFATLNAIRSKDPRVYDKSVQFYKEYNAEANSPSTTKERPLYLQDYHRQNLMAGYAGEEIMDTGPAPLTYDQEQDAIRRELVHSMHAPANGKSNGSDEEPETEDDFLITKSTARDAPSTPPVSRRAHHVTEEDVAAAEKDPETYLSNFMAARAWVPNETSRWKAFDSDDSEDEQRAEQFEEAYNMRFEDPQTANEKLQSFARDVGKYGVRRSEKSGRQRARERDREEREAAKMEMANEKALLRKLKIEEAEEKVRKIKHAAGLGGEELDVTQWRDMIEGDFDDVAWEAEMSRRFGSDYYAQDESNDGFGGEHEHARNKKHRLHKPKWEDEIDINDLVPDFDNEKDEPAFTLSSDDEQVGPITGSFTGEGEEQLHRSSKNSKTKKDRLKEKADAKRAARRERRQIEDLVDSSLPLSHADLPTTPSQDAVTGFRYRETSPLTFGLSMRDILFADDSQLNQYAGLKKMAAFRDVEKKRRDKKRYSKKGRLREWRKETFGSADGPRELLNGNTLKDSDQHDDEHGNVVEGIRKRKRKSNKNKGKMPQTKL